MPQRVVYMFAGAEIVTNFSRANSNGANLRKKPGHPVAGMPFRFTVHVPADIAFRQNVWPVLLAVAELRRSNLRAPVEALRDYVVLLGVPEGATILVNAHAAVIAPAVSSIRL